MGNKLQKIKDALGDIKDHQGFKNKDYNYANNSAWNDKMNGEWIMTEIQSVEEAMKGLLQKNKPTKEDLNNILERWGRLNNQIDINRNNYKMRF
jgi:hypothetical protein